MSTELKPCPFCGGDDLTIEQQKVAAPGNCFFDSYFISCTTCDGRGGAGLEFTVAADMWNMRKSLDVLG